MGHALQVDLRLRVSCVFEAVSNPESLGCPEVPIYRKHFVAKVYQIGFLGQSRGLCQEKGPSTQIERY